MSDMVITLTIPEALIERAEAADWQGDEQIELLRMVEKAIRKKAAGQRLLKIAEELQSLPAELKPSLDEIDEAVAQARREIAEERANAASTSVS